MTPTDLVGWSASLVLFLTLGRQVYVQWRERSTQGVSHWLFIGQITASTGFVAYSILVDNPVFIATNAFILAVALLGQYVYRVNARREEREAARSGQ